MCDGAGMAGARRGCAAVRAGRLLWCGAGFGCVMGVGYAMGAGFALVWCMSGVGYAMGACVALYDIIYYYYLSLVIVLEFLLIYDVYHVDLRAES